MGKSTISMAMFNSYVTNLTGAFYVGNGWVAGGMGEWDDDITSDDMDHSQKNPCVKRTRK